MSEYLHPGVYVQEVPSAVRPIEGVSTSTAAFIGIADMGPVPGTSRPTGRPAQPPLVTSFTEYTRRFGGFRSDSFLTYAAQAFFQNGGQRLYVVRVIPRAPTSPPSSPPSVGPAVATVTIGSGAGAVNISAANHGAWGNTIWIQIAASSDGATDNFKLLVKRGSSAAEAQGNVVESYDNVTYSGSPTLLPGAVHPADYVRNIVNSRSEYIAITADFTARPANTPVVPPSTLPQLIQLTGGNDGDTRNVDFLGSPATSNAVTGTGIFALDKFTDVNIIAIPGQGDIATVNGGIAYCKNQRPLQDCFFIGDIGSVVDGTGATDVVSARRDDATPNVSTIAAARAFATTTFNGALLDRSAGDYGAIYFPWVYAPDPIGTGRNPRILLPPSPFLAGIYARIDNSRGVFKAPAGTEAGVAGSLAPFVMTSDTEQDQLNPVMVNVLRTVPGSGLVVWGARTFASDAGWRYVPVRRMAIFLRVSIYNGIQWAVFEPNDEPLWASLRLNIRSFMLTQFRAGAFQGAKPDDAFFVKCDSSTTTQQDIDSGVVNILVGFAPLKPAEFVVLKLSQKVNQPAA
jgi:phage tail sheath protein FI